MGQRIDSFTNKPRTQGKYPWNEWVDGSIWRITRGVDFTARMSSMRSHLYGEAYRRGMRVGISEISDDVFEFQFTPKAST